MANRENAIAQLEELKSNIRVYASDAIKDKDYKDTFYFQE